MVLKIGMAREPEKHLISSFYLFFLLDRLGVRL